MTNSSKLEHLQEIIRGYESVLVAFSGGLDSTFVLKIARDVLGRKSAKAAIADSEALPHAELKEAVKLAHEFDVELRIIKTRELDDEQYRANSEIRCYFCKSGLYEALLPIASERQLKTIVNGTHLDDLTDFRPGLMAANEHNVKSPLVEAQLNKQEIRELSRKIGITIWNKPASPCLSSRFPYGHEITPEKLKQVELGEAFLRELGFKIIRLRHFDQKARVELGRDEFVRVTDVNLRNQITEFIISLGFKTVIFESYRSGRLNEEVGVKRHEIA